MCEINISVITRLPSNLRPTTRECVHLVLRGHFRSRNRDGGHTIRSAIVENPMLHANLIALCFVEPEFMTDQSFTLWNANIQPFCSCELDLMTFVYELDQYFLVCESELPTSSLESYHITACECMHLVMRAHFRSRDQDGGHTIRSVLAKTIWYTQTSWLCLFIERELWATKVLRCWNRDFDFFAPVTLTLTRWQLSCTNLTHIPWRYTGRANMNFQHQGFRKLSSEIQTYKHTYRQTDSQTDPTEIIYHAASRMVSNRSHNKNVVIYILHGENILTYIAAWWMAFTAMYDVERASSVQHRPSKI